MHAFLCNVVHWYLKKHSKIHCNERYEKLQRVSFQNWSGSNWPGCRAFEGKSRGQGRPTLRTGEIHFWEEEKYICNWQQLHWHLAMHFYLTHFEKMSVTLPTPSAPLSPSPSPNGNINSKRDSEEPWHVSTLFDSFCFWLTPMGNKQMPFQVQYLFVKKKYCSELFVSTFSWHVLRINIFLWPWRRRNAWWRLQLACNLVSYYICNKMSPCIEMRWQTSSFAMHNRDDHIWSRARLGICSNGIGRNTGRCLKEVKCTCRKVVY